MPNRYDSSRPGLLGYSIVHGTYIDLRLWKPQSEFWKYHISVYKARTGSDVFPSALFSQMLRDQHSTVDIPPHPELRAETVRNLSYIFIEDAARKENEAINYPGLNAAYHRAKTQMQKYLNKLLTEIRKNQNK